MNDKARKSASGGQEAKQRRKPTDWDAVERDYRTTQLTLRELGEKHGITNSRIAQKSKALGWSRDLLPAIRKATDALLIQAEVSKELSKQSKQATQSISETVITAADIKAAVVMRHRSRLEALTKDADAARSKLMQMLGSAVDIKEAGSLVSAVESAVRTEKILIEQERKSHRLDDDQAAEASRPIKRVVLDFVDAVPK